METRKVISTTKAPAAVGPYVQAIAVNGTLFMSGQIGINPETGAVVEGIEAQTHQVFKNIAAVLAEAGLSYDAVVKTTVYLTDMAAFGKVNEIYATYFEGAYPARSCVAVKELPKGALVEIEALALL